ncbi:3-deoxy-D-manno-octulosonic acid kinase [Paraferrimonas sp. SM1919]|uniref:3-deoxy-D-manno-octulosonic acid kinase n=1 Tax=Paraferrimonas sp. SM1919 TaxID=2662263 RepID=UPI0013D50504|nr:3-deoxy-D-manno-octulosonic acid kinase [Paraferrimonas sp. SM1919]
MPRLQNSKKLVRIVSLGNKDIPVQAIKIKRSTLAPVQLNQSWFKPQFWQQQGKVVGHSSGRSQAFFIEHGEQQWVLRHYYRGGLMEKFSKDKYLFTGFESSRALAEFTMLEQMYQLGLPVPEPVAAMSIRNGLWVTGDIIIKRIADTQDMLAWCEQGPVAASTWHLLGKTIAQFHQQLVFHSDLNIKNILFDGEQIYLIDFDNCHFKAKPGAWQQTNLDRLLRSLRKQKAKLPLFHWQESDWQHLLAGYQSI